MSNYIVSDTDLTSVADAIRTKGGTSASLEFPVGFVSAIAAISGGGYKLYRGSFTPTAQSSTYTFDVGHVPVFVFIYSTSVTGFGYRASAGVIYTASAIRPNASGNRAGWSAGTNTGGTSINSYNGNTAVTISGTNVTWSPATGTSGQGYIAPTTYGWAILSEE